MADSSIPLDFASMCAVPLWSENSYRLRLASTLLTSISDVERQRQAISLETHFRVANQLPSSSNLPWQWWSGRLARRRRSSMASHEVAVCINRSRMSLPVASHLYLLSPGGILVSDLLFLVSTQLIPYQTFFCQSRSQLLGWSAW